MAAEFVIRPATDADIPAIAEVYSYHVLHGTGTFELTPPDEAEIASRLEAVRLRGLPWLVAERDGEILGYAYAGPFRARPAYDWIVEDSVYVRGDLARQGVGRALLAALLDRCMALGYRQMVALIGDAANAGSISLHRRLGFAQVGLFAAVGWKQERWLDVVLMQRTLGEGESTPAAEPPRRVL